MSHANGNGHAPKGARGASKRGKWSREDKARADRKSLGITMSVKLMRIAHQRVNETLAAQRKIDRERMKGLPDFELIGRLQAVQMTNYDLKALIGEMNDRWGEPKRNIAEVDMRNAPPLVLVMPKDDGKPDTIPGFGWPVMKQGGDGARGDRDGAGSGNGITH